MLLHLIVWVWLRIAAVKCLQPHIVLIVADDYGWNDIGYHGSEIQTPNLDSLAAEGVKLENYYVQPVCTPSRSQLMSGRYQIHTGLQHDTIKPCQPNGLPLSDPTVADKLREAGYVNHIIGKWHLGFFQEAYTPTSRGFDSYIGYYTATEDYYTRFKGDDWTKGVDFHIDSTPTNSTFGEYSAFLYTRKAQEIIKNHDQQKPLFLYLPYQSVHDPIQVPKEYEDRYKFIHDSQRRTYAGMVSALDEGVGNVTTALKQYGLWNNTLVIFTTDNGALTGHGGNNAPLRGQKATYWEGGVRGVGFVAGPVLRPKGVINTELMHISDWFPTLIRLAGGSLNGTLPDGFDQWDVINGGKPSPRVEILHNIDPLHERKGTTVSEVFDTSVQAALRWGDWKILTGDPGFDGWVPEPKLHPYYSLEFAKPIGLRSNDHQNVYLFNIANDPSEHNDLSSERPDVVSALLDRLAFWNQTAVPVNYPPDDHRCNAKYHGGFLVPWM